MLTGDFTVVALGGPTCKFDPHGKLVDPAAGWACGDHCYNYGTCPVCDSALAEGGHCVRCGAFIEAALQAAMDAGAEELNYFCSWNPRSERFDPDTDL